MCWSDVRCSIGSQSCPRQKPSLGDVSGQELDHAEPVLLVSPVWLQIILAVRYQDIKISRLSDSLRQLAIHRRYTERRFLCIPHCYLHGITARPVPCNYYVIRSVVGFSRRKRGFKSRRGRQINSLGAKCLLSVEREDHKSPEQRTPDDLKRLASGV